MPLADCQTCQGSGNVPIWKAGPFYVEEGPIAVELPLAMCEDCLGTGKVVEAKPQD